jgi:RNA polymerase primary sigma factor
MVHPNYEHNSSNALSTYLKEISQSELLSAEEEISLSKKIKRGDKKALERMINANLRLVVKIANDYSNFGLPVLDLISEGNIGLMVGAKKFDPTRGARFSTYAAWWIKQSIRRALANQTRTIRLPVHMVEKLQKLRKMHHSLFEELGRDPTDEELAKELEMPVEKIAFMRQAAIQPLSLEAGFLGGQDDDELSLGEVIKDDMGSDPLQDLLGQDQQKFLKEALKSLSPRELEIVSMRFGLLGKNKKTLEEIGEDFAVTRERIRQLQTNAIKKLRHSMELAQNGKPVPHANPLSDTDQFLRKQKIAFRSSKKKKKDEESPES